MAYGREPKLAITAQSPESMPVTGRMGTDIGNRAHTEGCADQGAIIGKQYQY